MGNLGCHPELGTAERGTLRPPILLVSLRGPINCAGSTIGSHLLQCRCRRFVRSLRELRFRRDDILNNYGCSPRLAGHVLFGRDPSSRW